MYQPAQKNYDKIKQEQDKYLESLSQSIMKLGEAASIMASDVSYQLPGESTKRTYVHSNINLLRSDFYALQETLSGTKKAIETNKCEGYFGGVPWHIEEIKKYLATHQEEIENIMQATQLSSAEILSYMIFPESESSPEKILIEKFLQTSSNEGLTKAALTHLLNILAILKQKDGLPFSIEVSRQHGSISQLAFYRPPDNLQKPFLRSDATQKFYCALIKLIGTTLRLLKCPGLLEQMDGLLNNDSNITTVKRAQR